VTRVQLAAACALDALLGDPHGWPHPVRVFGALIDIVDGRRDTDAAPLRQLFEGALLTAALAGTAAVAGTVIERRAAVPAIVLAAATLAARSLDDAVGAVQHALERDDLEAARAKLAHVVGRDVEHLGATAIAAAALETLAESFCDGFVAPLFWLRAGGLGAALSYKAISTLDSMIGHREVPYRWFGCTAARVDDVANFVPARIAAAALTIAAFSRPNGPAHARSAIATALQDAPAHRSPNAGWPEAALAGALRVRLGGDVNYDGVATHRPLLGAAFRAPQAADLRAGRNITVRATLLVSALAIASAP
jgi:adenosylcobinamide-phosphate synthase